MDVRRLLAVLPACGALWIAAVDATPSPSRAPLAPPDGTYVYALSRDGTDQGTATVVLTRRDESGTFETNEVVAVGALRAQAIASYRYDDFSIASYVATYQAPFPRDLPLGRGRSDFYGQTTVRYRFDGRDASASIDGVRGSLAFARSGAKVAHAWIVDGPFMAGVLLLPAYRRHSHDDGLAVVSVAFPPTPARDGVPRVDRTTASPKTPVSDKTFGVAGLVRTWYRPANDVVDEARDIAFNLDARLVSYVRTGTTASFVAQPAPAPSSALDVTALPLTTADGRSLTGALTLPANARRAPLVVLVPPGADAPVDYGGAGPQPMFPDLARALAQRGFAVLRYEPHGPIRDGSSGSRTTWDASLAAARAAVVAARFVDGVDPARVYALGYATGADLALALGASDAGSLAGIVALGPTTGPYRSCSRALVDEPDAWRKSALAHDPAALAARVRVPLLVLHPGVSTCGDSGDAVRAFDATLRSNARASAIVASDLSQRFGGRYDADSFANGEAIFPYRFDASTASAIADWLEGPKTSVAPTASPNATPAKAPPPPPPNLDGTGTGTGANPHASPTAVPSASDEPAPGVILPSGETPPPAQSAPSIAPTPDVTPTQRASSAPRS